MKEFDSSFNTEMIKCEDEYADISSTAVRERLKGGDGLENLLPISIIPLVKKYYSKKQ